jgi:hypothetical protein
MGPSSAVASFGRGNRLSFRQLFFFFSSCSSASTILTSSCLSLPFAPILFPARLLASFRYLPFSTPLANPPRRVLLLYFVPCVNVQRDRRRVHPTVSREFTVPQSSPVAPTRLVHTGTICILLEALNVTTELCLAQCTIPGFILRRGDCCIHNFFITCSDLLFSLLALFCLLPESPMMFMSLMVSKAP